MNNAPVIRVRGLTKRYGTNEALSDIDFQVARGEIFGLIGPDGAGKTTCFNVLAGVMTASGGDVEILGQPPHDARLHVGYLTQEFSLYLDLSVDENLRYIAGLHQVPEQIFRERRVKYLDLMGLASVSGRIAGQLSGGMKQKLALCCALIAQPEILLLDEPTTGVDPVSRRDLWRILGRLSSDGVTIVIATPYLDEAERCNRVALMYGGILQQTGTPEELEESLHLARLEVRTARLADAERELVAAKDSHVADVQTFGDRLDVLVRDAGAAEAAVRAILRTAEVPIDSIVVTTPTLENVFVARLRTVGSDPVFTPLPRLRISPVRHSSLAIEAKALTKRFGAFQAVNGVDLTVHYGEIYGLLGANGAGKTTIIKMLCGLISATSGMISIGGRADNLRSATARSRIGYMSQKFTLYDDLTIRQNLEFYSGVYGIGASERRTKISWVLEICGLTGRENTLTGSLPGGWKQRVAFGASVLHEPEILFLDEPTSGVDPLARRQFWKLIEDFAAHGTAVLVTTHYLEEAEHCHRMGFMVSGTIAAEGSPSEIKSSQPGQLFEIVTDQPQKASDLLERSYEPWRVSLFGRRLHVVLDGGDNALQSARTILTNDGIAVVSTRAIPFSLEDAFIGIVQRAKGNAA